MTLDHPNIVALYGMFYDQENIYLVLELITGGHLFTQMKYVKNYPEIEAANIVSEVCAGLEHMHRMEIIHRDLKPENILLQLVHPYQSREFTKYAILAGLYTLQTR